MATDFPEDERTKWSPWAIAAAVLLLLIFAVITVGMVRGCIFVDPQEAAKLAEEQKKKDEEEKKTKKTDFELFTPIVMPSEPKSPLPIVKPGHWESVSQDMRANYRDFLGDSRLSVVDTQNRPYPVANTPFNVRSSRPVLLTKGRPKTTETTLFVPEVSQSMQLAAELEERGIGFGPPQPRTPLTIMPSYQYHFVVLAKQPRSTATSRRSTRSKFRSAVKPMPTTPKTRCSTASCNSPPARRSHFPITRSRGLRSRMFCGTKSTRATR